MKTYWQILALLAVAATPACSQNQTGDPLPSEPYRFVYSAASPGEVTLLDLNSVNTVDGVSEAWSLGFLAEPVKLENAPKAANIYWLRIRIDCTARTGTFIRAVGLENGQQVVDVPISNNPTPLADAWPLDEEFICNKVEATRITATTFAEAQTAAQKIIQPSVQPIDLPALVAN